MAAVINRNRDPALRARRATWLEDYGAMRRNARVWLTSIVISRAEFPDVRASAPSRCSKALTPRHGPNGRAF